MGARGEVVLNAGERRVTVLFTNRALAKAETALGRNVMAMLREASSSGFGMNDVAQLLQIGLDASRRENGEAQAVTLDDAYLVLDEIGYMDGMRAVIEALSAVMTFGGERDDRPPE